MARGLEEIMDKTLILSDIHIPFHDEAALNIAVQYAKKYKPDHIVLNGDILDFYSLSKFDKSPDRKETVAEEIHDTRKFIKSLRKQHKDANIYYLHGNHENRLQRFLWKNPELDGLEELELSNLLRFEESEIEEITVDGDYWANDNGHLQIGDAIIMHGDNRLNGASCSKYSGYSVKNTMLGATNMSSIIGHVHRGAIVNHTTPYGQMTGVECGCLCKIPGHANWQQGFVTFETEEDGSNQNYRFHHIKNGRLIEDGKLWLPK